MGTPAEKLPNVATPKLLVNILRDNAAKYHALGDHIRDLERIREGCRAACLEALKRLGERHMDIPVKMGEEVFQVRAQRYETVKYRGSLVKLLRERGLVKCLRVVVDTKRLQRAVESGKLSLEELREHSDLGWAFRVDRVRAEEG